MKKILFTVALLIFSSNAFAHGGADDEALVCSKINKVEFNKKMEKHQKKFLKKLDLTKDQENQVIQIRSNRADKIFAEVQKVRGAHTELMGVIEKDPSTKEEIRTRFNDLINAKHMLMNEKFEEALAIRDILTAEQRQKAVAEMKRKIEDMCD